MESVNFGHKLDSIEDQKQCSPGFGPERLIPGKLKLFLLNLNLFQEKIGEKNVSRNWKEGPRL